MLKSSKIVLWTVLAISLLSAKLWADGISNGGGSSGNTIAAACGGTTSSVFFSKAGICSGDSGFTYSAVGGTVNVGALLNVTGASTFAAPATHTTSATFSSLVTTTASIRHNNLVTGTNADFVCVAATGDLLIQTTACTISSLRFKPDWKPYVDNALTKVSKMEVGTFHTNIPNNDPNWQTKQAGLNAENIAKIAPECAVYEDDMKTPKSYRQECVIALLVRSIQDLQPRLNGQAIRN